MRRVKGKAPDELRNLSVSRRMAKEEEYEAAQKRLLARMRSGFNLGLKDGRVPWTRDEIHER